MSVTSTPALYDRLGGRSAVQAVVADFYASVVADADLKGYFSGTDIAELARKQVDFFTQALGGPARYRGKDMKTAHAGMAITGPHFDKVAAHLVETLRTAGVGQSDIRAIIGLIAPLRKDIVAD